MSQAPTSHSQPEKNSDKFRVIVPVPLNPAHTHRGITGSVLLLQDGSLLFAYADVGDTLRTPADEFSGGIAGRKSTDGGRTWGTPFTMVPNLGLAETISPPHQIPYTQRDSHGAHSRRLVLWEVVEQTGMLAAFEAQRKRPRKRLEPVT